MSFSPLLTVELFHNLRLANSLHLALLSSLALFASHICVLLFVLRASGRLNQ